MLTALRSKLNAIFYTAIAYSAILAYGQHSGFLDVRIYSSQEQAYQARLKAAEAEVARYAYSSDDGKHDNNGKRLFKVTTIDFKAPHYTQSVWVALNGSK